jgi:aspartokinase
MKRLSTILISLAIFLSAQATPEPGPKVAKSKKNNALAIAGAARFQFRNLIAGIEERDSMLIIFDRYDHTGAGIIRQVFAATSDESLTIDAIPPGKYYVTIQCIGLHRDQVEKVMTIRPNRSETMVIKLTLSEAYSKNDVVIPAFRPDPSNFSVVRFK